MLKSKINISNTIDLSISQCNAGRLLSNREIRHRQKRKLFAKSQSLFKKNKSSLARMIFDGDDITVDHTELPFSTQFNYWQKLFSEKSKQFDESFTDVNDKNVDHITCKEVENF